MCGREKKALDDETSHHEMNFHAYFNPSKKTKKDERETLQISKKIKAEGQLISQWQRI